MQQVGCSPPAGLQLVALQQLRSQELKAAAATDLTSVICSKSVDSRMVPAGLVQAYRGHDDCGVC